MRERGSESESEREEVRVREEVGDRERGIGMRTLIWKSDWWPSLSLNFGTQINKSDDISFMARGLYYKNILTIVSDDHK